MSKKVSSLATFALVLISAFVAEAQQSTKMPRIATLVLRRQLSIESAALSSFQQALRELGWVERYNVAIERRAATPSHLATVAKELLDLNIDVLVTGDANGARAVRRVGGAMPVVLIGNNDPPNDLFTDLTNTSRTVTGVLTAAPQLNGKRVELLKETLPNLSRLALLYDPISGGRGSFGRTRHTAQALGLDFQVVEVSSPTDLEVAFNSLSERRRIGILIQPSFVTHNYRERMADLAIKHRVPVMYPDRRFTDAGGFMSYGVNISELWRRAAYLTDRILKGASPADLPVEQPSRFELVINLKVAQAIGLTIPGGFLRWADEVIE